MREALDSGSLLVVAGAGFGKTTILAQALQDGPAAAWISVGASDRDPGAFLIRLVRAISAAAPGAGAEIADGLAAVTGPIDPLAAARELSGDLQRVLAGPLAVVVDDGERLEGADGSLEVLSALIPSGPSSLRVAVASRRSLSLRVAKARTSGVLLEISSADLSFTSEECAEVMRSVGEQNPAGDDVDAMVAATGGWPLGVSLMSRSGGRAIGEGRTAPGEVRSRAAFKAFFAEEVLAGLDPGLRSAAVDASVAELLTPALSEALGLPPSALGELERAGLAIHRGSAEDGALAYHPLLREFLLERLDAERSEEGRRALHASAAGVAAAEERPIEAIEHWLAAGRFDRAAEALSLHGLGLVHSSPGLVRALVDRLPPGERTSPGILLLEAHLASGRGEHQRAADSASDAIAALSEANDPQREWMARFVLVEGLYHLGEFGAGDNARGFDDPGARDAFIFAPATAAATAACLASDGRFDESDELAEAVGRHPEGSLVGSAEAIRLAYMDLPRGRIAESVERLRASLSELDRDDPFSLRLYTMSWLGFMLEEAGSAEEVLAIAERVAEDASDGLAPFMALHARNWRAQQNAAAGRLAAAEEDLARGGPATPGWLGYDWELANAAVASLRGEHRAATEAAERALEQVRGGSIVFRFWCAADLIPVFVASGKQPRAREVVEETLAFVTEKLPGPDGRFLRARLLAFDAWLRYAGGDGAGSDTSLLACWRDAGPEVIYILRRQWSLLEPVVRDALERGVLDADPVVAAVADAAPPGSPLTSLLAHPSPAVRRAALEPAIASGDPDALRALGDLGDDPDAEVAKLASRLAATAAVTVPPRRFGVLGGFTLRRGTWQATDADWGRPAAGRLVRFLLIHRGLAVPEEEICEALWRDLDRDGGRRSLRVAATRARKVIDLPGTEVSAIEVSQGCYSLVLDERDSVDADIFEAAAARALEERDPGERRRALERARHLWSGEPLPLERYSEWAIAWREHLLDHHIAILAALATLCSDEGDHLSAIDASRELVALDPMNEGAQRLLIAAYARAGRTGQALHQFLVCRRGMIETIGVEPSAETAALQAAILAGEPV